MSNISSEIIGQIMVITIDRPKANAISAYASKQIFDWLLELESRPELRAGIITGSGSKFFSAGWDLKAAAEGESHSADQGSGGFAGITKFLGRTKPIIAAVNGSAYGGGVELMLACDLVVASQDAVFAFPEASLGLLPDAGGLNRLPRMVPPKIALELLLTGRSFSAHEALEWGLINRVVAAEDVLEQAKELAESICRNAPLSVSAILEAVSLTQGKTDREAFNFLEANPRILAVPHSGDAQEGLQAFGEKRLPVWTGK